MTRQISELHRLARLHGVQTAYYDVNRRRHTARPESLLAVLRALGVDLQDLSQAPARLREDEAASLARGIEPVIIAWDGGPTRLELCLPAETAQQRVQGTLVLESGETMRLDWDFSQIPISRRMEAAGDEWEARWLPLAEALPAGYHRLTIQTRREVFHTLVISAPKRTFCPSRDDFPEKAWGIFAPLYAVQSNQSWGAGTYRDLGSLGEWLGGLGGSVLATLPALPAFLGGPGEPYDPSPYAPVSRLFWNEFYIDVASIPDLDGCPAALALVAESRAEIDALRALEIVDYRRVLSLKRRVLEALSADFFHRKPARYEQFRGFLDRHPAADDYARFRATIEKQGGGEKQSGGERPGGGWSTWPARLRDGNLDDGDFDAGTRDYYLYAQWIAGEQMEAAANRARTSRVALYLDLPLGVSRDGYDVWRHRDAFVTAATAGAPPDPVYSKGQNWGFPPMHPQALRAQNYGYLIELLRHHLQFAGLLRIDHAMGLHRLYWIPDGMEACDGVYVHYRADELYAILSLESHRHQAALVGENLGTVPEYVNAAMNRHRIHQMYVVQYELEPDRKSAIGVVPQNSAASLNTHDMPTFAAFWKGDDIDDRQALGLLDAEAARREHEHRGRLRDYLMQWLCTQGLLDSVDADLQTILRRLLDFLALTPAEILVVTLEDLWLETRPQNVPGTSTERPNWLRKARHSLEEIREMPEVVEELNRISQLRSNSASAARDLPFEPRPKRKAI